MGSSLNLSNAFSSAVLVLDNSNIAAVHVRGTFALILAGMGVLGVAARRRKTAPR